MLQSNRHPPLVVDYDKHPGFAAYSDRNGGDLSEQLKIFSKLDEEFNRMNSDSRYRTAAELDEFAREHIAVAAKELETLARKFLNESDLYLPIVMKSIGDFEKMYLDEVRFRNESKRYRNKGKGKDHETKLKSFFSDGFYFQKLDPTLLQSFWEAIEPWRKKLEERRSVERPKTIGSCVFSLPQEGKHWKLFLKMIKETGIATVVNDFCKYPMDLDYAALQLSHDGEEWWKGCYADLGLPDSKLAYLHYDEDFALVKAIIYLQPVSTNGAFSLIPTSAVKTVSYSRDVFIKRLDVRTEQAYMEEPGVLDFPYVRKQFKLPKFREGFIKLPAVMRSSTGIGDDILDGTPLSDFLLSKELRVTSDLSNCIVFSGGHVLHRGGMVQKGERWAIQVGFRLRDKSLRGLKNRMKSFVKRNLPNGIRKIKVTG